jgi:uncharacterized FlgJ-related protein
MYYKFNKEKLAFEKVSITSKLLIGIGAVLGTLIFLGFTFIPSNRVDELNYEEKLIIIKEYNEFSQEKLVTNIEELNFKFPHIILAQSMQETGNFKSGIFKENNNLFGMKEARMRATLAQGTNRGHAHYNTWQESLYDYAMYYNAYLRKIKTEDEYFEYLRQNYAEDPEYVSRLKSIIKKKKLKELFKQIA